MSAVQLACVPNQQVNEVSFQWLRIKITQVDGILEPSDLKGLVLPSQMNWRQGVVIEGQAPIWLYGYLVHECHPSQWVACFDPRLGAIVVSTHSRAVTVGEMLHVQLP
jgi:CRISPR-associated protein Csx3